MSQRLHVLYAEQIRPEELEPIFEQLPQPPLGGQIAIKPNLVVAKKSESGATTDPALVECIIAYLKKKGHSNITIMESSAVGTDTKRAFAAAGYGEISEKYNVPLVDLKRDKTTKVAIQGLELNICRAPMDADFLINVPVLKAHCQTRITCALKNLKGCIPDSEKRRFHQLGLHRPIAALSGALATHWTIVDGIIGDLTFEEGGTPIHMGRIIMGDDPVLIDTYVLQLLGYTLKDVPYVSLAADLQVGSANLEESQIVEHQVGRRPQTAAWPANPLANRYRKYIHEKDACSACYGSLIHALKRYEEKHGSLPDHFKFAIGQGFADMKESTGGKYGALPGQLGIGKCTQGTHPSQVPGCPPTARRILEFLEG